MNRRKWRRIGTVVAALLAVTMWLFVNPESYERIFIKVENNGAEAGIEGEGDINDGEKLSEDGAENDNESRGGYDEDDGTLAINVLEKLDVKGRAPKTGYTREEFYNGWPTVEGCNLRQRIIKREFGETAKLDGCIVISGEYDEPYTGEHKIFTERGQITSGVQIDHVVALSDAWQKGAQYMDKEVRYNIATDPLNLLAVDSSANQKKSDGDAATWLPPNKKFRCQYVARQVSVKYKYALWVTEAEKTAIREILTTCPGEKVLGI